MGNGEEVTLFPKCKTFYFLARRKQPMSDSPWNLECSYRDSLYDMLLDVDPNIDGHDSDNYERYLLFTTYKLDIQLFEEQVLAGMPGIDAAGALRVPSRLLSVNRWLNRIHTTVLYDSNGVVNNLKRTQVDAIPVFVENGVFHPKIILYAYGNSTDGYNAGLIVGSANLTRSGIAENIESQVVLKRGENKVSIIRGKIAADLSIFLRQIKSKKFISKGNQALQRIQTIIDQCSEIRAANGYAGIRLLWSIPGFWSDSIEETLWSKLKTCNDFIAICPYLVTEDKIEPGLPALIGKLPDMNDDQAYLCPAPTKENPRAFCLSKAFYTASKTKLGKTCWQVYRPFLLSNTTRTRFAHAKICRFESNGTTSIIIGSHNLTFAAWGNGGENGPKHIRNIEASLLIDCIDFFRKYGVGPQSDSTYNDFIPLRSDFETSQKTDNDQPSFTPILRHYITFDWDNEILNLAIEPFNGSVDIMELNAAWLNNIISFNPKDGLINEMKNGIDIECLSQAPTYSIIGRSKKDGELFRWCGFVLETNRHSRPLNFSSLNEMLLYVESGVTYGDEAATEEEELPEEDKKKLKKPQKSMTKNASTDIPMVLINAKNWYDFYDQILALKSALYPDGTNLAKELAIEAGRLYILEANNLIGLPESLSRDDNAVESLTYLWLFGKELSKALERLQGKGIIKVELFFAANTTVRNLVTKHLSANYTLCQFEEWFELIDIYSERLRRKINTKRQDSV